jgi:hypothetical protein
VFRKVGKVERGALNASRKQAFDRRAGPRVPSRLFPHIADKAFPRTVSFESISARFGRHGGGFPTRAVKFFGRQRAARIFTKK